MINHQVQIDCDSYDWAIQFCKQKFENEDWLISKFSLPDDSHTISFVSDADKDIFLHEYKIRNPKYDTNNTTTEALVKFYNISR